ncbi:hypothetical protein CPB83DRAFT_291153 [Crepidotus variabilis]|uniref:RING-type domain-containing protein n=1 Tax=Crepidotus variabilis TaxID=179855 RepID=A0A9P6JQW3_9AGAR|nr:hypothetical protein CPB83DRAFT_291153 [Crepidotus variabilis]
MSAANCPVCLNNFSLDAGKFAVFTCGHGFCTDCIGQLLSTARPKCPQCRVLVTRRDAHPVYLEVVDSHTFLQTSVIDGLNKMGPDTPLISVRKAGPKLEKILQDTKAEGDNLMLLLKAVEDFKERIIPTFDKVEGQKQQIKGLLSGMRDLRKENEAYRGKQSKNDILKAEVTRLKSGVAEKEENRRVVVNLLEAMTDEMQTCKASTEHWKKKASDLEQDNRRYKDQLERHTNNARTQKEKNRKLAKDVAALKEKLAAIEKEPTSAVSCDYDGDFSTHENSRVHLESSFRVQTLTPAKARRYPFHNENLAEFIPEGIPPPNFPSDWQIDGPNVLRKRTHNGSIVGTQRRVANPFPISLDRKGQPTSAVQLGPRTLIRLAR